MNLKKKRHRLRLKLKMNRMNTVQCILISIALYVICGITHAKQDVLLSLGDVRLIEVGEVTRLAVGDDEVVTASVLDTGEIMFIPLKPGYTEVVVWDKSDKERRFRVLTMSSDVSEKKALVDSLLANFQRVSSRIIGDRILLEGMVDPERLESFNSLIENIGGVVSFVEGVPRTKDMIRLKVQVLEVDKRYQKELGIDWGDSAQGPIFGTIGTITRNPIYRIYPEEDLVDWGEVNGLIPISDKNFYPYAGLATTLTSRLNLLQENGAGRILAAPNLSTRSGETATFLAGGEIPFPFIGEDGRTTVEFRDYGVQLEILPILDGVGNIVSKIKAEVSSIDTAVTVLGVPGLLVRETQSTVNIKPGETIAIAGLLSTNDSKNIDSIPILGEMPVIGRLFRSESFQEQRTEIIFLVTTEIVDQSAPAVGDEKIKKHLEEMREVRGNGGIFSGELAE